MEVAELKNSYNRHLVIIPEPRLTLTTLRYNPLHRGVLNTYEKKGGNSSAYLLVRIFKMRILLHFTPQQCCEEGERNAVIAVLEKGFLNIQVLGAVTLL